MNEHTPKIECPASYQDVLDARPNMVEESVAGRLHLKPRPAPKHARAYSALWAE